MHSKLLFRLQVSMPWAFAQSALTATGNPQRRVGTPLILHPIENLTLLRSVAMTYGAACLGLAGHSTFLAPRGEPVEAGDDSMIVAFLSSEVAREAGGALIMALTMAL